MHHPPTVCPAAPPTTCQLLPTHTPCSRGGKLELLLPHKQPGDDDEHQDRPSRPRLPAAAQRDGRQASAQGGGGLAGQQEASPSFTTARLGGCRHCHWSPGAAASMPGMQCTAVEGHSPPPRVSCHPSSPAVEAEIDTSISASASASRKLMQLGVNAGERRQPTHAAAPAAAHARRQPGHAAPATAYLATYS